MQAFGGPWTLLKLEILEKYLHFYITAMRKQRFKLCYIDAFAGSGNVNVKGIGTIPGSAIRAIDYSFDRYIFIEKDLEYAKRLEEATATKNKNKDVTIEIGDCNELLNTIHSVSWFKNYWRGVIFLDPYAMNLRWESLEAIAKTQAFDVWYLFPLSAMIRVMQKDGNIPIPNKKRLDVLLGTNDWEEVIYTESPQLSLFGEQEKERTSVEGIKLYIINRLKSIYPAVSHKSLILRNPLNNSPLFLLCFATSNPSPKAIKLSLKAADHILTHTNF